MALVKLPYELLSYVVQQLDLADVCSLSFTCKTFQFLLHEHNIAKLLLETKAPHSTEARDAGVSKRYASALRRLIKRREAIASVSPYLVAIVGLAETWLYENGVLCYVRGPHLRILDLHRSGRHEIVVQIPRLLDSAVDESRAGRKFKFRLLYYSHGFVSCLFTQVRHGQGQCNSWLVVFSPRTGEIVTVRRLESTTKIFVRNNDQFLYYGTNSQAGADGHMRWVIAGFDLDARAWLDQKLHFPRVIGSDVGSTVCFDIIDGYFYGLSNQASLEVEEVDWVSYYTCFRFPLSRGGFRRMELPPRQQFWRRNHVEGPLDDRWCFLRLFKDETTGQLKVVESRKEWLSGRISARRTYYTTVISFDHGHSRERRRQGGADSSMSAAEETQQRGPRDPHMVHPGDDSSTVAITLSKCPVRAYYPSSQAFIDLVNDAASFDPSEQQIRIRGGSRRLWTPAELEQRRLFPAAQGSESQDACLERIEELYKSGGVTYWPPKEDPLAPDPALADLHAVLNPPGHLGNVHGSWDERSLVYATGGTAGDLKALVFVSWDPSHHLAGIPPYPGHLSVGGRTNVADARPGSGCQQGESKNNDTTELYPVPQPGASSCPRGSPNLDQSRADHPTWISFQPASYREISRGYHFAR